MEKVAGSVQEAEVVGLHQDQQVLAEVGLEVTAQVQDKLVPQILAAAAAVLVATLQ